MNNIMLIISKAFPVIYLIILGNLMRRFKYLNEDVINHLKKIVMNFSLPAILFLTFAQTKFESQYIILIPIVCGLMCLMLYLGGVFQKIFKSDNPYFPTVFCVVEGGMIGYPLFITVYGTSELYKLAILDIGQALCGLIVMVSFIKKKNGNTVETRQLLLDTIKSPIMMGIFSGVIFSVTGIMNSVKEFALAVSVLETLKLLSNLTTPMICIALGYELRVNLRGMTKPLMVIFTKILILMGFAFLISTFVIEGFLKLDYTFSRALYILCIFPVSFIIPIIMEGKREEDRQFVLNTISLSVVVSLFAFMILITTL